MCMRVVRQLAWNICAEMEEETKKEKQEAFLLKNSAETIASG